MRITLVNPPLSDAKSLGLGRLFFQRYEPLGILYIAAVAQENGYPVEVIDCEAQNMPLAVLKQRLLRDRPDVMGISTLTLQGAAVFDLGRWLKASLPETFVVLGNIHASVFAEEYLRNGCCDAVVHGEGEYVFLDILRALETKRELSAIPSLSYRDHSGTLHEDRRPAQVADLAVLPPPARTLLAGNAYGLDSISNQIFVPRRPAGVRTIITSRGCPNSCCFCAASHGRSPRFNSPRRIVDEMQALAQEAGVEYFYIEDSLFVSNKAHTLEVCREIERRGLDIRWGVQAHVNFLDPEMLGLMERAGCYDVAIGIESGVQRLLNLVSKGTRRDHIVRCVEMVKSRSRIKVEGLFMLGLPDETRQEALETIAFAKSLPLDLAQFSICTPYPGSPLFGRLRAAGQIDAGVRPDGSVDTAVWNRYFAYPAFAHIEPICAPSGMTGRELVALQRRANREFYCRPKMLLKNLKRARLRNASTLCRLAWKGLSW